MKTKLLVLVLFFLMSQVGKSQVEKIETYKVGTKITYYPGQCAKDIPEAKGKISFCDKISNLGVVEASYGLNSRVLKKMVENYFNKDEVFLTSEGISIRKENGSWDNIPNLAIPKAIVSSSFSHGVDEALLSKSGFLFFKANFYRSVNYIDMNTKTFKSVSLPSNSNGTTYTHSFAYDEITDATYILTTNTPEKEFNVFKFQNGNLSVMGSLGISATGSNNHSQLLFTNDALYFGTDTGLYKYNKNTLDLEASYFTDNTNYVNNVRDIVVDNDGNIWTANWVNNGGGAIYKLNTQTEAITTFELALTEVTNYRFDKLAVDGDGNVWSTPVNWSGFIHLNPIENNPEWTFFNMADIENLGFKMAYAPDEIFNFNNKIYVMTTTAGTTRHTNFEAMYNDQGVWHGINDDEPKNISHAMITRSQVAYPDADGVWFYNDYDSNGTISYMSNSDTFKRQYEINGHTSFLLDADGIPVVNDSRVKKLYMPYIAKLPDLAPNSVEQLAKYKDQIWVYSRRTQKIDILKYDKLVETIDLKDTDYQNFYHFTPDIYGNAYFARVYSADFYLKKFDTNTQTTETFEAAAIGAIKKILALPNGNVAIVCARGVLLFNGTTLVTIDNSDYADLGNIVNGVVDIDGDIFLLTNDNAELISIKNPESNSPTFETIILEGGEGIIPESSFYRPVSLAIDNNGAFWSNASESWLKLTTEHTAEQFLNGGETFGIHGLVYFDKNENNQFDAGEGYANQKVTIITSKNNIFETYTNADGKYYFPYYDDGGNYDIRMSVVNPYVVATNRQIIFSVSNLEEHTTVNDFQLKSNNIETIVVKSSSKLGAWAFNRAGFNNTFTTAVGNMSDSKSYNDITFDYVYFNEDVGSDNQLPEVEDVIVTKLAPKGNFHLLDYITIEPKGHTWGVKLDKALYSSEVVSITPKILYESDTTKVKFTLPKIDPLDTYIIEVKTDLFQSEENGTVVGYGFSKAASKDFEDDGNGSIGDNIIDLVPPPGGTGSGFSDLPEPFWPPSVPSVPAPPTVEGRTSPSKSDGPHRVPIRSSYAPNDKLVTPGVAGVEIHETPLDYKWLTYTIRFQNDGNFSAKDVFIIDVLDEKFDQYSLSFLESSHPMSIEIIPSEEENIVKFNFNDIYLDYTANSETENQGYVTYMIKVKDDVDVGDILENQASIYFDQNPPILTNVTQNKFTEMILDVDEISENEDSIQAYPNPVEDVIYLKSANSLEFEVALYTLLGQHILTKSNNVGHASLKVSDLKTGMYLLKITSNKDTTKTIKFIKN
ncbi:DUF7619 domain-containing protein [Formosa haliotis]|uniref:DUF7619 domain-containing protein n=1 Tax=Formosa haliotis TaxID=1555194 RepID=UPI001356665F|nr:T9SS type A sorting domain-containing protein [Formosa haliotis]